MIHPTAVVDPRAELGSDVEIGPFAVVEGGAVLGDRCVLHAYASVRGAAVLGQEVVVDSHAVVGADPQMGKWDRRTRSGVRVGDRTVLREMVTIHRGTKEGSTTTVGSDCLFMVGSHVGHDCAVGNSVTMANCVLLAGHVTVGDHVFFGGDSGVHQFVRVGEGTMVGAMGLVTLDAPPFTIVAGRNRLHGLNLVGLRRRGVPPATVQDLKQCFRALFLRGGDVRTLAARALAEGTPGTTAEGRRMLEFCTASKRGFGRYGRGGKGDDAHD